MNKWLLLGIAILAEVIATTALRASDGFTRTVPAVVVCVGYAVSFYFLALALRSIPIGVAYAIWSGLGVVIIATLGWLLFGQKLDAGAIIGMALIVAGVVTMNLFSRVGHQDRACPPGDAVAPTTQ